jgi:uncharacterized protein (TIGR02996 family)
MARSKRQPAPQTPAAESTDERALLNAILAHPDEDTPRLAYADWLDETGGKANVARAEYIRLQIRRAGGSNCVEQDPVREDRLLEANSKHWKASLPKLSGVRWGTFVRGFPQVTVTSGMAIARNAEAIWAASPVERVQLQGFSPASAKALAACPYMARVRILDLRIYQVQRIGVEPLRTLLASEYITGLRELLWDEYPSGGRDAGVQLIAECPRLPALETLMLGRRAGITEDTALKLARSPHLPKLKAVRFQTDGFSSKARSEVKARFPDLWNS